MGIVGTVNYRHSLKNNVCILLESFNEAFGAKYVFKSIHIYGTLNTSEVTSIFVDDQKFVLTIRNLCYQLELQELQLQLIVDMYKSIKALSSNLYGDYKIRCYIFESYISLSIFRLPNN